MAQWSIDEWLEHVAECGEMGYHRFLGRRTINRLRKDGFLVIEKSPSKVKGQVYCYISWSEAGRGEQEENLSQANRLFRMAEEAKKN